MSTPEQVTQTGTLPDPYAPRREPRAPVPWVDLLLLLLVLASVSAALVALALDHDADALVLAVLTLAAVQFGRE